MSNNLDFLCFEDWTNHDYFKDEYVIVTIRNEILIPTSQEREERISMYSFLIPNNSEQLKKILERDSWIAGWEYVKHLSERLSIEAIEFEKYFEEVDGVKIQQFLCYKDHNKKQITIIPEFMDEFNLRPNDIETEFFDNDILVIKFSEPNKIEIKLDYLREYLFRKKVLLIRNFDCRRKVKKPSSEITGKTRKDVAIQNNEKSFYITIGENKMYFNNIGHTDSKILGKNTIFPQQLFDI